MDAPGTRSTAKLSAHRREYERRVYRVMDCVQAHLDEDLTLEKLAGIAAFSPFHFHRVFAAITGETFVRFHPPGQAGARGERACHHMIGYWGVGLGGAVLFAFGLGLGGTGIWLGITLAFVFAVILLTTRFSRVLARLRAADQRADAAKRTGTPPMH